MRTRPDARLILAILPYVAIIGFLVWVLKLAGWVDF